MVPVALNSTGQQGEARRIDNRIVAIKALIMSSLRRVNECHDKRYADMPSPTLYSGRVHAYSVD